MRVNKASKKVLILGIGIGIIGIITILVIAMNLIIYNNYPKSTLTGTRKTWYTNYQKHTLMEVTDDGDIYEHNFKEKAKLVISDKELIYLCEDNSRKSNGTNLIIHKDGSIYVGKSSTSENSMIGRTENAVSGALNRDNMAIITADGLLYFHGKLGDHTYQELSLVTGIPLVKQVICGETYTVVLTQDGEVYGIGLDSNECNKTFQLYATSNPIVNLSGNDGTIIALDTKGRVHVLGYDQFGHSEGSYNQFHLLKKYKNIVSITSSQDYGIFLGKNGRVYYWGNKCVGKASDVPTSGFITGIFFADGIYLSGWDLYISQNDKIIHVVLED